MDLFKRMILKRVQGTGKYSQAIATLSPSISKKIKHDFFSNTIAKVI